MTNIQQSFSSAIPAPLDHMYKNVPLDEHTQKKPNIFLNEPKTTETNAPLKNMHYLIDY
jgi:hypothetical protein